MTDLNHVIEIGRLTRDIGERDFGYTTGGTARLNLSIAVNRSVKLHKGKQIAVDGFLDQQRWEKDGQKFSKVVIVANTVQLLGGNENNAAPQEPAGDYAPASSGDDFPEDLPF